LVTLQTILNDVNFGIHLVWNRPWQLLALIMHFPCSVLVWKFLSWSQYLVDLVPIYMAKVF